MASRGINKVILVGNLGNDPEHRVLPLEAASPTSASRPPRAGGTKIPVTSRSVPSGIASCFLTACLRSRLSTCAKAPKSTLRVHCGPVNGRISQGRIGTPLKLSPRKCKCSTAAIWRLTGVATKAHRQPVHRSQRPRIRRLLIFRKTTSRSRAWQVLLAVFLRD